MALIARQADSWKEFLKTNTEQQLIAIDSMYRVYKNTIRLPMPAICQFTSVKYRIFAHLKDDHTIFSEHSARFNRHFNGLPDTRVFVNNKPIIDSVYVYQVPGENLTSCDTAAGSAYRYKKLYAANDSLMNNDPLGDTVIINSGNSYFLRVYSHGRDSSLSFQSALAVTSGTANAQLETFYTFWNFAFDSTETAGVSPFDLLNITNDQTPTVALYPSKDHRIQKCTFWLELSDGYLGEILRPQASTDKEFYAFFVYK
jgi:hypothetical protein